MKIVFRRVLRLIYLSTLVVAGCGRTTVDSGTGNLDLTAIPFEGFQFTVTTSPDAVGGIKQDSGELGYSLKGCEMRVSQNPSLPFSFARAAPVVKLKSASRLKDCTIQLDSLNFDGKRFVPIKIDAPSYIGKKTGIGIYISDTDPGTSYALIPSKNVSKDEAQNVMSITLLLVKQISLQTSVAGEMPPVITLSDSAPLFFEGVDPDSGVGRFRIRFKCMSASDTLMGQASGISDDRCIVEGMANHKIADYEILISRRTTDDIALLPDEAEAFFSAGSARIKKFTVPADPNLPYLEVPSLAGEDKMIDTGKLWLLVRYTSSDSGMKSYAAWQIESEKL
jgi:hypothetical protein